MSISKCFFANIQALYLSAPTITGTFKFKACRYDSSPLSCAVAKITIPSLTKRGSLFLFPLYPRETTATFLPFANNFFTKKWTAGVFPVPPTLTFPIHITSTSGTFLMGNIFSSYKKFRIVVIKRYIYDNNFISPFLLLMLNFFNYFLYLNPISLLSYQVILSLKFLFLCS